MKKKYISPRINTTVISPESILTGSIGVYKQEDKSEQLVGTRRGEWGNVWSE